MNFKQKEHDMLPLFKPQPFLLFAVLLSMALSVSAKPANVASPQILANLYSEAGGMYTYAYPGSSKISFSKLEKHSGNLSLKLTADPAAYSGGAFVFSPVDISSVRSNGGIEFWVKGEDGGESFEISLVNSEKDKIKVELPVSVSRFANVTKEWSKVTIPFSLLSDMGSAWNGKEEAPYKFNWSDIAELKIRTSPTKNPRTIIYIDDVNVVKLGNAPVNIRLIGNTFEKYAYTFPEQTAKIEFDSSTKKINPAAIKYTLPNNEFSGAGIAFATMDLTALRAQGAVLSFCIKSVKSVESKMSLALVDAKTADNIEVESVLSFDTLPDINDKWQNVSIPLSSFSAGGLYWDIAEKKTKPQPFLFDSVCQLKLKNSTGDPADVSDTVLWIDDIRIIKK